MPFRQSLNSVLAIAVAVLVVVLIVRESTRATPLPEGAAPPEPLTSPQPTAEPPNKKPAPERLLSLPTRAPDRIILTWKGDPATTQAVTWRTDTSVSRAVAEIALADPGPGVEKGWRNYDPKKVRSVPATTQVLKTAVNEAHYHTVEFDGLSPKTRYMYRVGDGAVWSEWFQFDTASDRPEPFGFIYYGDAQNGLKTLWSRVVRGAYSDMPKARFIVHAGDLVNSGSNDNEWGEWHSAPGWINGMVPSVPTPGNHEYGGKLTAHWRPQFALPENGPPGLEETCYFMDYQGVRLISLNSNEKIAEQVPWLEQVLASRTPDIRWTVVTFHHPIYSTAKGRDNKKVREAWRPVFDRFGVDLVLQGHDHTYGRSGLMREDNLLTGSQVHSERGTVYVVSVSGAKMYSVEPREWMQSKAADVQLYQLIYVDGSELRYESRTARGDVHDSFTLRKRPDGGNDLIEGPAPPATDLPADTPAPSSDRVYWNAVAAIVILSSVVLGLRFAFRRANGTSA